MIFISFSICKIKFFDFSRPGNVPFKFHDFSMICINLQTCSHAHTQRHEQVCMLVHKHLLHSFADFVMFWGKKHGKSQHQIPSTKASELDRTHNILHHPGHRSCICRSNLWSKLVTVCWYLTSLSQHKLYNTGSLAVLSLQYQCLRLWCDSILYSREQSEDLHMRQMPYYVAFQADNTHERVL